MYLNIRAVTYHHNTEGNGFLFLGIRGSMKLHLALIQMAYLVQFAEEVRKTLLWHFEIDQTS
jgi:hypothetical protein